MQFGSSKSVNIPYYNTASLHFKKEIALLDQASGPSSPVPHLQIGDANIATEARNLPHGERPAYNQEQKLGYLFQKCFILTNPFLNILLFIQLNMFVELCLRIHLPA